MIGVAKYSFYIPAPIGIAKDSGTVLGPIGIFQPVVVVGGLGQFDFSDSTQSGLLSLLLEDF